MAQPQFTETEIRSSYKEHAVLAQFYRWFQVYERPEGGMANAIDLLAEDVVIASPLGDGKGPAAYEAAISQLPSTWRNAHFPEDIDVRVFDDGSVSLTADAVYLNLGVNDDGSVRAVALSYATDFVFDDPPLPAITSMKIVPAGEAQATDFEDAYLQNRGLATVHYYLSLVEDPARDPEPFQEVLAEGFSLNFPDGAVSDFDGFKTWLAGPGSSVTASTHKLAQFEITGGTDESFSAAITFDWAGITADGTRLVAKTRHNWDFTNDVTERFARLKTMNVEILEPFRPEE